ncbi:MAG TPA: alpha/beta hydrolase [bacterium]|nr:alpha/beta hydrolase [bacterium]
MAKTRNSPNRWVLLSLAVLVLAVLGGLYFIYGVLPGKVAQSIAAKAKVKKPVTETPAVYGMSHYEAVTIRTPDGIPLAAWWIPAEKKKDVLATVLLTHGAFKNREQVLSRALFLHKLGCQVLIFDQRGCGQSGDAPLAGGVLEYKDFPAARAYLESRHSLKGPLVYFGFSMGAISALRAAIGTPNVSVIADSPLANLKSYVSRRTMGAKFAAFPGFLQKVLSAYDQDTGLDLKESDLDLLPVVKQLNGVPTVYITGEKDDLAKSDEVRKLFEATTSRQKRLIYIPDAGHEETYKLYPMIYEKVVEEFLKDLKAGFPKAEEDLMSGQKKKGHSTQPMK